jgi:hypothetical protein
MGRMPADRYVRKYDNRDPRRVEEAALRLDHLIRNALYPTYNYPGPGCVSPIKAFVRHLDATLPSMQIRPDDLAQITPRMDFCREIMATSDKACTDQGVDPVSLEWFEDMIARHGGNMRDLVYHNPFWYLFYMGTSSSGGALASGLWSSGRRLNEFHRFILGFWN